MCSWMTGRGWVLSVFVLVGIQERVLVGIQERVRQRRSPNSCCLLYCAFLSCLAVSFVRVRGSGELERFPVMLTLLLLQLSCAWAHCVYHMACGEVAVPRIVLGLLSATERLLARCTPDSMQAGMIGSKRVQYVGDVGVGLQLVQHAQYVCIGCEWMYLCGTSSCLLLLPEYAAGLCARRKMGAKLRGSSSDGGS